MYLVEDCRKYGKPNLRFLVVDADVVPCGRQIASCRDVEDADKICEALNRLEKEA